MCAFVDFRSREGGDVGDGGEVEEGGVVELEELGFGLCVQQVRDVVNKQTDRKPNQGVHTL